MQDTTQDNITMKAKATYDLLMNSGKWRAKSSNQEKIIALKAQLKDLQNLKLSVQLITSSSKIKNKVRRRNSKDSNRKALILLKNRVR